MICKKTLKGADVEIFKDHRKVVTGPSMPKGIGKEKKRSKYKQHRKNPVEMTAVGKIVPNTVSKHSDSYNFENSGIWYHCTSAHTERIRGPQRIMYLKNPLDLNRRARVGATQFLQIR